MNSALAFKKAVVMEMKSFFHFKDVEDYPLDTTNVRYPIHLYV